MPQVASPSTKAHAHGHAQARPPHSARAEGTPSLFDSLVDQTAGPQQYAQGDTLTAAQPSGQKAAAGQAAKADAGKDQAKPQPSSDTAATADGAIGLWRPDDATAAKAVIAAVTDAAKADTAKDASKDAAAKTATVADADASAIANPPPPAIDPSLTTNAAAAAAAITPPPASFGDAQQPKATGDDAPVTGATTSAAANPPPAIDPSLTTNAAAAAAAITPPPAPSGDAQQPTATGDDAPVTGATAVGSAVAATTIPTTPAQAEPVEPAFVAAANAQKLQPFEARDGSKDAGKDKAQPGKSAATAAPQPAPADDQAVPPPPQPGSAAVAATDAKPDPADKAAAKDAQPHRERTDAATAKSDIASLVAPDGSAAATQAASAASGTSTAHGATASTANAAPQGASNALQAATVPMAGLAVEIAGRAHAGKNNFEIRLDPPELGRIEVKLSVDRQGQVTSHLIADRQDTLDLLRRDASGLERALQDAGLKIGGDGLQFSLRDQSFNGRQNGDDRSNASHVVAMDDTLPAIDAATSGYTRYAGRIGGVDIRV